MDDIYIQVNVTVSGGAGLRSVTTAFSSSSANIWQEIGALALDQGVTQPEITFTYATNHVASQTRLFFADAIRFLEIPTAPVITESPVDQAVVVGGDLTFSSSANGTDPLSYQWQKDGVDLPGKTDSPLTIIGVQTSDAGIYTVTVTNLVGSVVSSDATLTVNVPAAITVPPVSQEVIQGQNVTFTVSAIGDAPLGYQWQLNGGDMSEPPPPR